MKKNKTIRENKIIRDFIGLCIPSISPDAMEKVEEAIEQVKKSRHLSTDFDSIIKSFKKEICCVVDCHDQAKYEMGEKDKPLEPTFACEKHKNVFPKDWIQNIQ